ncbi:MAG: nucleotidyltransferase domain-containing protein [Infirmifilum sp.]
METYVDILVERSRMVREWKSYIPLIVKAVRSLLPDAKVYVFGSVVRGEAVGGSDVDILIVSSKVPESNLERARLKTELEEVLNLPLYHPFQFHLADEEESKWYFRRVKDLVDCDKILP